MIAGSISSKPVSRWHQRWHWRCVVGLALCLAFAGWLVVDRYWPYRYENVKPLLENVFASKITVQEYRRIYFPHPGFIAHGLVLQRHITGNPPPIGSVQDVLVSGRWIDLLMLRKRVQLVDVAGLRIVIPPVGSEANHADFPPGSSQDFAGPSAAVGELHLRSAELDIQRVNGGVYAFPIRDLEVRDLQKGKTVSYVVDMQSAVPTGHIQSHGHFGPLNPTSLGTTPVSGEFTFTQVQLSDIGTLHGTLAVSDSFHGQLDEIRVDASSSVPDFSVGKGRATAISATLQCLVNALNGGVVLQAIDLKTGSSTVHVEGAILGSPKTTNLTVAVQNGRVEDLLRPFLKGTVPLVGPVWLDAKATLAPTQNGAKFLQRLQASGSLNAPAGRLTNHSTQQSLSAFSQRAQGARAADANPDADVVSSLAGQARVVGGVVSTQGLSFRVPGAVTNVSGTYSLTNTAAHFTGNLTMDADISHVTTGFKSLLLKPLAPFFRKGGAGAVIPIAITGSSGSYKVRQNILHDK